LDEFTSISTDFQTQLTDIWILQSIGIIPTLFYKSYKMKVTLITGASGGIGEAIVNRLAERNQNLVLVARNSEKLEKQCRKLKERFGISAQFIACDLSKPKAAFEIFEEIQIRNLEIEMLINNAGIGSGGEFVSISLKSEVDLLQLNILSLVALTHLFLPSMMKERSGTIVNIGSMAAFMPVPYMATYAASKAFVRSFTQALTQECAPYNLKVLLFCPGLTKTNFNSSAGIENEKAIGLSSDYNNSPAQTPQQVADELLRALDKGKHFAISGRLNRISAAILTLLPNTFITSNIARMYRKRLKI
jgi:short-subunit dehydrogenase